MTVSHTLSSDTPDPAEGHPSAADPVVGGAGLAGAYSRRGPPFNKDGVAGRKTWFNTFRARSDRVIAVVRIMLAVGSIYIAWLDSTHPLNSAALVYALLLAYLSYAVFAAVFVWKSEIPRVRGTLTRHLIDVLAIAAFMVLSDGVSSPFFMFMPFVLLAATVHWHWQGALWTALACVVALVIFMTLDTTVALDPDAENTIDISRILFVVVAAVLLIWLGAHQQAVRTDLVRLVEKMPEMPEGRAMPVAGALEYAAHVMQLPRILLIWSDADEPWTYLAYWNNGLSDTQQLPPSSYLPWTAERLQHASLLVADAERSRVLIHQGEGRFREWSQGDPAINQNLVADYSIRTAVTVSFEVGDLEARIFLLDPPTLKLDDVAVAEIIADRVRALFQQALLTRKLSDEAVIEERIKIGRDLHDGMLQSLAGTALQLEALRSLPSESKEVLNERLKSIQTMLSDEQRELRAFIRALEPGQESGSRGVSQLAVQFAAMAERLGKQWSIDFTFVLEPEELTLPTMTIYELVRMTSEATANAVRHGEARRVTARVSLEAGCIMLVVDDDGRGFSGVDSGERFELKDRMTFPRSLYDRAAASGGTLSLEREAEWTRVAIRLPIQAVRP